MERNTYIDNIDLEEAKEKYLKTLKLNPGIEEINLGDSLGRITSKPVFALVSSPNYNASAMDGIAIRASLTLGASETNPIRLKENEDFVYVNTGNPIREPYDSVIMIEDVIQVGNGQVEIIKASYPWQDIRQIGEDIIATEMIVPSNHRIRPMDLGGLVAGGIQKISVFKKPRVGILPTGTEIVENVEDLVEGRIIDSNSRVFEGLVSQYGGQPLRYHPQVDDYDLLKAAVLKGVEENDILIINAGSSAGTSDYTVKIIEDLGQVIIHGLAIKPGKPTILGIIDNKPVIGIPGYPVSAYLVFEEVVKPLIESLLGSYKEGEDYVKAKLSKRIVSSLKNLEYVRVTMGYVNGDLVATPLPGGAGVSMSLIRADGIAIIPRNVEGLEAGSYIDVRLLKPKSKIMDTLVSIGSHDIVLDILGDMMGLSSSHVGSLGGIASLVKNECHMAPIHLLDETSGDYNIDYIKKYFPGEKMVLIKGLERKQGFIVKKGNPHGIKGLRDLLREGVTFANRQRGSGTRILLDYMLKEEGIDSNEIIGYQRELNTHMGVATAVKTGSATCGLGVYSAAKALDLDFIEMGNEEYDFLIKADLVQDHKVQDFIRILKSDDFKSRVERLGGYGFDKLGSLIEIG